MNVLRNKAARLPRYQNRIYKRNGMTPASIRLFKPTHLNLDIRQILADRKFLEKLEEIIRKKRYMLRLKMMDIKHPEVIRVLEYCWS